MIFAARDGTLPKAIFVFVEVFQKGLLVFLVLLGDFVFEKCCLLDLHGMVPWADRKV